MRWTLMAGLVGFASSGLFSSLLGWPRGRFVAAHAVLVAGVTVFFFFWHHLSFRGQFGRRWPGGLVAGVLVAVPLVRNVLGQPGTAAPEGPALAWSLVWLGAVYGLADAMLLTIVPVLALYGLQPADRLRQAGPRVGWGMAALAGSLLVTSLYHLGFAEFRGPALLAPLIGNAIITAGYLVSGSPVAPVISHVLMHAAAVMHGIATTTQLPPHS